MTALALATRSFTPLSFRPEVERRVAVGLSVAAVALWLFAIPLELALAQRPDVRFARAGWRRRRGAGSPRPDRDP